MSCLCGGQKNIVQTNNGPVKGSKMKSKRSLDFAIVLMSKSLVKQSPTSVGVGKNALQTLAASPISSPVNNLEEEHIIFLNIQISFIIIHLPVKP